MRYFIFQILLVVPLLLTAQSKKEQISTLHLRVDSLSEVIINERINNAQKLTDKSDKIFQLREEIASMNKTIELYHQQSLNYKDTITELHTSLSIFLSPCSNQSSVSHQGYEYDIVQIGDQCWFSENCRYLPVVSPSNEGSETSPYYYVYGYEGTDVAAAQTTDNYATYGVLYNWPAVMTEGMCPSGWHIPSHDEFSELTDFLGDIDIVVLPKDLDTYYADDYVACLKMKEAGFDHWDSDNTGATNSSGWTGLPGGYRYFRGFAYYEDSGYWWSASASNFILMSMYTEYDNHAFLANNHSFGFSARCVRDD